MNEMQTHRDAKETAPTTSVLGRDVRCRLPRRVQAHRLPPHQSRDPDPQLRYPNRLQYLRGAVFEWDGAVGDKMARQF